jgi:hypothetical protein
LEIDIIKELFVKGFASGLVGGLTVWLLSYGYGKIIKVFKVITT